MKKLILLFCLVIGQFCFGQESECKVSKLSMHTEVVPIIEEYIEEGKKRGFYLRSFIINKIDNIYFVEEFADIKEDRLGTVGNNYRDIYLSPKLKNNPLLLKVTIFHEIGHIIKPESEHTCFNCYDIMSTYAMENTEPFSNPIFWELKLDEYFKWLNKKE